MFSFFKGAAVGAILTFVIAELIGHAGGTGGMLHVKHMEVQGFMLYWSWGLFVGTTLLGWGIFTLLE